MEEIEQPLSAAKSWKAPGKDSLPAIVYRMEDDLAHSQAQGPRHLSSLTARGHTAKTVETREDHTAQEAD